MYARSEHWVRTTEPTLRSVNHSLRWKPITCGQELKASVTLSMKAQELFRAAPIWSTPSPKVHKVCTHSLLNNHKQPSKREGRQGVGSLSFYCRSRRGFIPNHLVANLFTLTTITSSVIMHGSTSGVFFILTSFSVWRKRGSPRNSQHRQNETFTKRISTIFLFYRKSLSLQARKCGNMDHIKQVLI